MALTFPINLKTHLQPYGMIRPMRRKLSISDNRSYAEAANGDVYVSSFGTALWQGSITVTPMNTAQMRQLEARIRVLQRADAVFFIGDTMDDPANGNPGSPLIAGVNASTGVLNIKGMTGNYAIRAGMRLSWRYGNRYAYHETVEQVTAGPGGVANVEVNPPIEPGWEVDTPILMGSEAYCAAVMMPGTLEEGEADGMITQGFTFTWRQTLRG